MDNYRLKLIFKDDENYDIIYDSFKRRSVNIQYYRSFIPPNIIECFVGPLSKLGVENILKKYSDFDFNFEVLDIDENRILNDYEKNEFM